MAGRVGVLGAKGGAEGVDPGQSLGVGLDVELAGDRKEGGLTEEVLGIIHGGSRLREPVEVEGRHLEHLARPFAVRGRDEGRVDVLETAGLEELVDAEGHVPSQAAGPEPSLHRR